MQEAYAKYVNEYYLGSFGVKVQTYDQKHLKNTAITEDSADRLWWFQVCTEVAFFQVAPLNDSIRSSKVDTRHVCHHRVLFNVLFLFYLFSLALYFQIMKILKLFVVDFCVFYNARLSIFPNWFAHMWQIPSGPLQKCLWRGDLS